MKASKREYPFDQDLSTAADVEHKSITAEEVVLSYLNKTARMSRYNTDSKFVLESSVDLTNGMLYSVLANSAHEFHINGQEYFKLSGGEAVLHGRVPNIAGGWVNGSGYTEGLWIKSLFDGTNKRALRMTASEGGVNSGMSTEFLTKDSSAFDFFFQRGHYQGDGGTSWVLRYSINRLGNAFFNGTVTAGGNILATGYIGIGITPPVYPLDIESAVGNTNAKFGAKYPVYIVSDNSTGATGIGLNAYYSTSWKFGKGSPNTYAARIMLTPAGGIELRGTASTGAADSAITFTSGSGVYVNRSGGLGIGVETLDSGCRFQLYDASTSALAVIESGSGSASLSLRRSGTGLTTNLHLWNGATQVWSLQMPSGGNNFSIHNVSAAASAFFIRQSDSIVGINTNAPKSRLDVRGRVTISETDGSMFIGMNAYYNATDGDKRLFAGYAGRMAFDPVTGNMSIQSHGTGAADGSTASATSLVQFYPGGDANFQNNKIIRFADIATIGRFGGAVEVGSAAGASRVGDYINFNSNGAQTMRLLATGGVALNPQTWTTGYTSSLYFTTNGSDGIGIGYKHSSGLFLTSYKTPTSVSSLGGNGSQDMLWCEEGASAYVKILAPSGLRVDTGRVQAYNATNRNTYIELAKYAGALPGPDATPNQYAAECYPVIKTDFSSIYFSVGGRYTGGMEGQPTYNSFNLNNKAVAAPYTDVYLGTDGQYSYIRTGRFGIGNNAPGYTLDVTGNARTTSYMDIQGRLLVGASNGSETNTTPNPSINGTLYLDSNAGGYGNGAAIYMGTVGKFWAGFKTFFTDGTDQGVGYMAVYMRPNVGSAALSEVMRFNQGGSVSSTGDFTAGGSIYSSAGRVRATSSDVGGTYIEIGKYANDLIANGVPYPVVRTDGNYIYFSAGGKYVGALGWNGTGSSNVFAIKDNVGSDDLIHLEAANPSWFVNPVSIGTSTVVPTVTLTLKSMTASGSIIIGRDEANSEKFALNLEGGIPAFYDKYNGSWVTSLYLKAGSVGIGTNNPSYKLHVAGRVHAADYITSATSVCSNDWFRSCGTDGSIDGGFFKVYGHVRSLVFRTDASSGYGNNGDYYAVWLYGGDDQTKRLFIMSADGNMWFKINEDSNADAWLSNIISAGGKYYSHGKFSNTDTVPKIPGWHYYSGTTGACPHTGNQLGYKMTIGFGSDYTISQYALELLMTRDAGVSAGNGFGYMYFRHREGGTITGWNKIKAGYADSAGAITGSVPASSVSPGIFQSGTFAFNGKLRFTAAGARYIGDDASSLIIYHDDATTQIAGFSIYGIYFNYGVSISSDLRARNNSQGGIRIGTSGQSSSWGGIYHLDTVGTSTEMIYVSSGAVQINSSQSFYATGTCYFGGISSNVSVSDGYSVLTRSTSTNDLISSNSGLVVYQSGATGAYSAFMTFHRGGLHAEQFGLDTTNKFYHGGWSRGGKYYFFTEYNIPNASQVSAGTFSGSFSFSGSLTVNTGYNLTVYGSISSYYSTITATSGYDLLRLNLATTDSASCTIVFGGSGMSDHNFGVAGVGYSSTFTAGNGSTQILANQFYWYAGGTIAVLNNAGSLYLSANLYASQVRAISVFISSPSTSANYGFDAIVNTSGEIVRWSSSLRYKENVNYDYDASFLKQLKPVTYTPIGHEGFVHHGLIAEDVYKTNPLFVPLDEQGRPDGVKYTMLVVPIIKFVCDLDKKIDNLETRLSALEGKLS